MRDDDFQIVISLKQQSVGERVAPFIDKHHRWFNG
jgi:hypothetical protein